MYENFYGLTGLPFQLTPDPRLLFHARDHTRAESYLLYGLQRCEGLVVITGHVGTGKTLLLQSMLEDLRDQHLAIARVALANLDGPSVMPSVAAAFGIEPAGLNKFELMERLTQHLMPSRRRGSLLIVDEAQAASIEALEELRTLSNLQTQGRALIQIFLIGQTELHETLARSDMSHLRQRIVASHHLRPLDSSEVQGYIDFRLEQFGRDGPPYLDQAFFDRVYEWSGGIPRRINLLMDRVLLFGYLENKTELAVDDLETVIAEFAEEFSDDLLIETHSRPSSQPATTGNSAIETELHELSLRVGALEQAMRNEFGQTRVDAYLSSNKTQAEYRALADVRSHLTRLENILTRLARERANHEARLTARAETSNATAATTATETGLNGVESHAAENGAKRDFSVKSTRLANTRPNQGETCSIEHLVPIDVLPEFAAQNDSSSVDVSGKESMATDSTDELVPGHGAFESPGGDGDYGASRLQRLLRWTGNGR